MKTTIIRMNYSDLRNESHVEYHETVDALFARFNPETLGVAAQYGVYKPALEAEVALLDLIRKSEYTAEITEKDHERDLLFRGFTDAVKSAGNHFDPSKRKAADNLGVVLKNYGNIASRTLDSETAAIDDILRELNDSHIAAVETLSLGDWLVQLAAENEAFKDLMSRRYTESAQRPTVSMKAARTETDRSFRDLLAYLEALFLTGGDSPIRSEFVKELNAVSERYKNQMAQAAGRRATK